MPEEPLTAGCRTTKQWKNDRENPKEKMPTMKTQSILAGVAIMMTAWNGAQFAALAEGEGTRLAPNIRPSPARAAAAAESPDATTITALGEHELFADDRGAVVVRVDETPAGLVYTVSLRDEQGVLTKGPWPLRKADGWMMVARASELWVFDGHDTVRLVQLISVEDSRGLSDKTAQEFPAIMAAAPKPFVDRLPAEFRKGILSEKSIRQSRRAESGAASGSE